jgi:glycogen synthase
MEARLIDKAYGGPTNTRRPVIVHLSHDIPRIGEGIHRNGYSQAIDALHAGLGTINGVRSLLISPHLENNYLGQGSLLKTITLEIAGIGKVNVNAILRTHKDTANPVVGLRLENGDPFAFQSYKDPIANNLSSNGGGYVGGMLSEKAMIFNLAAAEVAKIINSEAAENEKVIFQGHDHLAALATALAEQAGIKTVFTIHNPAYSTSAFGPSLSAIGLKEIDKVKDSQGYVDLLAMVLKVADIVTTVSPSYAEEIGTRGFTFGPKEGESYGRILEDRKRQENFVGILNGLPADFAEQGSSTRTDSKDEVRILMASRATRQKGWQLFLDGIKGFTDTLKPIGHNVKFDFLADSTGDKDLLEALVKAAAENKDNVTYEAYTKERMDRALTRATIALMPSLWEPCGLFAMTAQARGVLLLATRVGGLQDILGSENRTERGESAPFYKALGGYPHIHRYGLGLDITNIWGAISSVLANLNNSEITKIVENAKSRAQRDYTPEAVAKRYMEKVYGRFLKA